MLLVIEDDTCFLEEQNTYKLLNLFALYDEAGA
jgi:hypothetical protein